MSDQAQGLDAIFGEAVDIDSAQERKSFLRRACGDDLELLSEVERLVADYFRAGDFLERPVAEAVADLDFSLSNGRDNDPTSGVAEQIGEAEIGRKKVIGKN